jgi:hypothetical protein
MAFPLFTVASGNEAKAKVNPSTKEVSGKLVKATCHSGLGNCMVVGD